MNNLSDLNPILTAKFASDFLGRMNAGDAIETLVLTARGATKDMDSLRAVYGNSDVDAVEYANEKFFMVLGGKLSVARFVEDVILHVAVQGAYERAAKAAT